jgi:riboflavin biosynthesis pyrimidine reductase
MDISLCALEYSIFDYNSIRGDIMETLTTLFDEPPPVTPVLTPELQALYGGDLALAEMPTNKSDGRAFCYANFVATIDGIVSFNLPNHDTGNEISGGSPIDHVVMGILRALAGAVIWGSKTYHASRRFTPIPAAIWKPGEDLFAAQRMRLGMLHAHPIAVVVTASGELDTTGAIFQNADLPAIVATTDAGAARLGDLAAHAPATEVWSFGAAVMPDALLRRLRAERGVRMALCEGGATLLGAFLAAGTLDELFLTRAPQFAGRANDAPRPGLVEGVAFTPATAPWAQLVSLKRSGSQLFERYRLTR